MGNVIMKAQQITYGASNVEKALDDLKAPELIELNKRMAAIDEWKANVHEVTYTGSELTIENALALPARSLITSINAIQDLHGYDHPWVGGAGKNKFGGGVFTESRATYTFDVLTGACKVTATSASNDAQITIRFDNISDLKGQTVTFSIKDYVLSNNNLKPYVIWYKNGVSGIINSSLCDSPTSGITKLSTSFTIPNDADYIVLLLRLDQNTQQTVGDYIQFNELQLEIGSSKTSFEPWENKCPISGRTEARVDTENEDSSESAYAVIQLGTTVYGADINWDTGVMTVKTALVTLNGTEDWNVETTTQSGVYRYSLADGIDNIKLPINNNTPLECNSNMYVGITANESYVASKYGISNLSLNSDKLIVIDETYHTNDATAWKAYLANNPLQIEYVLATPTTIQLTPEQLEMLKGYNRVTIDSGSIELKALVLGGDI